MWTSAHLCDAATGPGTANTPSKIVAPAAGCPTRHSRSVRVITGPPLSRTPLAVMAVITADPDQAGPQLLLGRGLYLSHEHRPMTFPPIWPPSPGHRPRRQRTSTPPTALPPQGPFRDLSGPARRCRDQLWCRHRQPLRFAETADHRANHH